MFQWMSDAVSYVQFSESTRWIFLFISAVLSALFTEMVFKDRDWMRLPKRILNWVKQRKWVKSSKWAAKWKWTEKQERITKLGARWMWYFLICIAVFVLNVIITLLLLYILLQFEPEQESLHLLLKEIAKTQGTDFVFPLIASVLASWALKSRDSRKKSANVILCGLLVLSTVSSSVMYFLGSFKLMNRPQYSMPIESISSIVNSRLNSYPFALSGELLREVGDGSRLLPASDNAGASNNSGANEAGSQNEEYEEPNDFIGYLSAIMNNTYAPGHDRKDYLFKAYNLFFNGEHNNDYFYIGALWHLIYLDISWFEDDPSITAENCLEEAISAYKKSEDINGGNIHLSRNMLLIYIDMDDRASARECVRNAMKYNDDKSNLLSVYVGAIYNWTDQEKEDALLADAATVLNNQKNPRNLSMCILYSACAISLNSNVEDAYNVLSKADEDFQNKSAMVKILKCICADLAGIQIDDAAELRSIYALENTGSFSGLEDIYLMRYLFLTNRYEELWGYIADVGGSKDEELDADSAAIKANWYVNNPDRVYSDKKSVESLLKQVEDRLANASEPEEKEKLLLSQLMLRDCLGMSMPSDVDSQLLDEPSPLQNAFYATEAFNKGQYASAIEHCEAFFEGNTKSDEESSSDPDSMLDLQPHEQMVLHYHMQLILADSYFQYARTECVKNSKEWKSYLKKAENECDAFAYSTKSLSHIENQFNELRDRIDMENGKLPEKSGENN